MSQFDNNLSSSQDEISLFLRQILLRSSSSSSSNASPLHHGKISAIGSTLAANVSSSSLGLSGNDTDDYDCESEVLLLKPLNVFTFLKDEFVILLFWLGFNFFEVKNCIFFAMFIFGGKLLDNVGRC